MVVVVVSQSNPLLMMLIASAFFHVSFLKLFQRFVGSSGVVRGDDSGGRRLYNIAITAAARWRRQNIIIVTFIFT